MKKLIVLFIAFSILFMGFGFMPVAKAQTTPLQQEVNNQLIKLLLQLIAQLQQQINEILAQQAATNKAPQKTQESTDTFSSQQEKFRNLSLALYNDYSSRIRPIYDQIDEYNEQREKEKKSLDGLAVPRYALS